MSLAPYRSPAGSRHKPAASPSALLLALLLTAAPRVALAGPFTAGARDGRGAAGAAAVCVVLTAGS